MLYLNATNDISRPLPLFIFKERGCKVMNFGQRACNGVNGTSRKLHEMPHLKLGSITADFQEFADGVDEPLVVVVTHPLNFLVMVLDVIR